MSRDKEFSSASFKHNDSSSQSPEPNFRIITPLKKKIFDKKKAMQIKARQLTLTEGFSDKLSKTESKKLKIENSRNYKGESVNSFMNESEIKNLKKNKGESLYSYRNKSESKDLNFDRNIINHLKSSESKQTPQSIFRKGLLTEGSSQRKNKNLKFKTKSNQFQSETFCLENKNTLIDKKTEQNTEINGFESKNNQLNRRFLKSIRPITQKNSNSEDFRSPRDLTCFGETRNRKLNFSEEEFSELTLTNNDNFKRNLFFVDFNDKKFLNIRNEGGWRKGDEKRRKSEYNLFLTEKENENGINGKIF